MSFIALWLLHGRFQTPESFQFLFSLFADPDQWSWILFRVITERVLSQVHAAEMGILRWVHGLTLRDEVRSYAFHKALIAEPLWIKISQPAMCPECSMKDRWDKSCLQHPRQSGAEVVQVPSDVITSPALFGPSFVFSRTSKDCCLDNSVVAATATS